MQKRWIFLVTVVLLILPISIQTESRIQAPDFEISLEGGKTTNLKDLRGSIVFVDFWASWCPTCKKSMEWISSLEERFPGLKVVTVNLDSDPEDGAEFLKKKQLKLLVKYDPEGKIAEAYFMKAMPSAFLIGKDGTVISRYDGYSESRKGEIEGEIKKALDSRETA